MITLCNAFSLNMLDNNSEITIPFKRISEKFAKELLEDWGFCSAVGHADTAAQFESILGLKVEVNRANVSFEKYDTLIIGQYKGPRLPEGTKTLPEGAVIQWWVVGTLANQS